MVTHNGTLHLCLQQQLSSTALCACRIWQAIFIFLPIIVVKQGYVSFSCPRACNNGHCLSSFMGKIFFSTTKISPPRNFPLYSKCTVLCCKRNCILLLISTSYKAHDVVCTYWRRSVHAWNVAYFRPGNYCVWNPISVEVLLSINGLGFQWRKNAGQGL